MFMKSQSKSYRNWLAEITLSE